MAVKSFPVIRRSFVAAVATGLAIASAATTEGAPPDAPPAAMGQPAIASMSSSPSAAAPLAPGTKFRDCPLCPEMIVIPPGSFIMGTALLDVEPDGRDGPPHPVSIEKGFAAGVYDVTRAQYAAFVRETSWGSGEGCNVDDGQGRWVTDRSKNWRIPGFHQTDLDPVVCVSWNDAQAYVRWLNSKVGGRPNRVNTLGRGFYHLLSEAEWEYAARAGTTTQFYWGNSISHDDANYGLEQCNPCGVAKIGKDRWYYTSPAGAFAPNSFGLYDMFGNVWQWTQDCLHPNFVGAPRDGSAWMSSECRAHVLRGGSWLDPSRYLRVVVRNSWPADDHNYANGFRVARALE